MPTLSENISRLHTTPLGAKRIAKNLNIPENTVLDYCQDVVRRGCVTRRGKNYYVTDGCVTLTIHAGAYTIITAKKASKCRKFYEL